MNIRDANEGDCARIAALWNPVIENSDATFNSQIKSVEELIGDLAQKRVQGLPFLLAEMDGEVAGFATCAPFRASNGYRRTMEHTIILAGTARRRGVGRRLMAEIEDRARKRRAHSMIAAISAANGPAIAFHAAIGYRETARLAEVGWKFGRWYDLVIMQKFL